MSHTRTTPLNASFVVISPDYLVIDICDRDDSNSIFLFVFKA